MERLLTSTSGQKVLVMSNILVVNRIRQSLMFLMDTYYNIMMMSTFSDLNGPEGQK